MIIIGGGPEIRHHQEPISWRREMKYIEITIHKGKVTPKYTVQKSMTGTPQLYPMIGRNSRPNLQNKRRIFFIIIRPTRIYAASF